MNTVHTTHIYAGLSRRVDISESITAVLDARADDVAKIVKRYYAHMAKCAVGEYSKPLSDRAKGEAYDTANVLLLHLNADEDQRLTLRPQTMDDIAGIIRSWRGKGW